MTLVLVAAVASAILVLAIDLQAGSVVSLTAVILVAATLGILFGRATRRAFCLGFAVPGWAYFSAAFSSPQRRLSLPTTRPLAHLYDWIASPTITMPDDVVPFVLQFHDYLQVSHSLVALAIALAGGLLAASLSSAIRLRRKRAVRPAA
jgi:hypothetical protein